MCEDIYEFTNKHDTSTEGIVQAVSTKCFECRKDLTEEEIEEGIENGNDFRCFDCLEKEWLEEKRAAYECERLYDLSVWP